MFGVPFRDLGSLPLALGTAAALSNAPPCIRRQPKLCLVIGRFH
jgi:hypothetical protein